MVLKTKRQKKSTQTVKEKKATAAKNDLSKSEKPTPQYCHWLMKSEPESRYENGVDVKVF